MIKIEERFTLIKELGQGSFSTLYSAEDSLRKQKVALKIEKPDKSKRILMFEYDILKQIQGLKHTPEVYDFIERKNGGQNFIVMKLLGKNLAEYKKILGKRFTVEIAISFLVQMIDAIEEVHSRGFIHRDIKPSNYVIGKGAQKSKAYIVDFGLAKLHLNNGVAIPMRQQTEFRGTITYASLNAHHKIDLSRRDDLWSFYFLVLDLLNENIPWKNCSEFLFDDSLDSGKDEVKEIKMKCLSNPEKFLWTSTTKNLMALRDIFYHIKSLKYEDKPNYAFVKDKLYEVNAQYLASFCHYSAPSPFQTAASSFQKQSAYMYPPVVAPSYTNGQCFNMALSQMPHAQYAAVYDKDPYLPQFQPQPQYQASNKLSDFLDDSLSDQTQKNDMFSNNTNYSIPIFQNPQIDMRKPIYLHYEPAQPPIQSKYVPTAHQMKPTYLYQPNNQNSFYLGHPAFQYEPIQILDYNHLANPYYDYQYEKIERPEVAPQRNGSKIVVKSDQYIPVHQISQISTQPQYGMKMTSTQAPIQIIPASQQAPLIQKEMQRQDSNVKQETTQQFIHSGSNSSGSNNDFNPFVHPPYLGMMPPPTGYYAQPKYVIAVEKKEIPQGHPTQGYQDQLYCYPDMHPPMQVDINQFQLKKAQQKIVKPQMKKRDIKYVEKKNWHEEEYMPQQTNYIPMMPPKQPKKRLASKQIPMIHQMVKIPDHKGLMQPPMQGSINMNLNQQNGLSGLPIGLIPQIDPSQSQPRKIVTVIYQEAEAPTRQIQPINIVGVIGQPQYEPISPTLVFNKPMPQQMQRTQHPIDKLTLQPTLAENQEDHLPTCNLLEFSLQRDSSNDFCQ